jgi:hypothetical protein
VKLSAYIITVDCGFSPNPFGEKGDVVVAVASASYAHEGKLVYAMKVREVITLQEYWEDPRFGYKKPTAGSPLQGPWTMAGCSGRNAWNGAAKARHGRRERPDRDRVLLFWGGGDLDSKTIQALAADNAGSQKLPG